MIHFKMTLKQKKEQEAYKEMFYYFPKCCFKGWSKSGLKRHLLF